MRGGGARGGDEGEEKGRKNRIEKKRLGVLFFEMCLAEQNILRKGAERLAAGSWSGRVHGGSR